MMNLNEFVQTMSALGAISMILVGSLQLKACLKGRCRCS